MACDFRVAAESAVFGQPEINLGIIPGFGGTQRLPRLVGQSKALEMNLTGDAVLAPEAREYGLADDLVPDEQLLDVAISWAKKLGAQAPLAVEEIKQRSNKGDLDDGIAAEKEGFAKVFQSEDGKEGISAFLAEARARVEGQVATDDAVRLAELIRESECTVALTGAGISVPSGIPDFRTPGTGLWENVDPMEVAHIDAFRSDPEEVLGVLPAAAARGSAGSIPTPPTRRSPSWSAAGILEAVITQNIDTLHTRAGLRAGRRGPRLDPDRELPGLRRDLRAGRPRGDLRRGGGRDVPRLREPGQARRGPVRRDAAGRGDGRGRGPRLARRPAAVRRLLARGVPGRRPARR